MLLVPPPYQSSTGFLLWFSWAEWWGWWLGGGRLQVQFACEHSFLTLPPQPCSVTRVIHTAISYTTSLCVT